jgi:hypothetical protein
LFIQRAATCGGFVGGHSGGQVGIGSSKRLEWEAGAASWMANMLAVASASQKDSLSFFIWFFSYFFDIRTQKGPGLTT